MIGRDVYRVLGQLSSKLVPEFANWHEPVNVPISSEDDWATIWCTNTEMRAAGSSFQTNLGSFWRRKHSIKSSGSVSFSGGSRQDATFAMQANWSPDIQWWDLFTALCQLTKPAHGMVHLLTDTESAVIPKGRFAPEMFTDFVGGEMTFTGKVSPDGNLITPDIWNHEARRNYCSMPQLAWGNWLGGEFAGQYDPDRISSIAANFRRIGDACRFSVTNNIADLIEDYGKFSEARRKLRKAFREGFFTLSDPY
jgi:hypothetical protein